MLKLIAPFRVFFNLDDSLVISNPSGFAKFLEFVSQNLSDPQSAVSQKIHPSLSIEVNSPPDPDKDKIGSRFTSMDKHGSQYARPNLFTLRFKPSEAGEISKIFRKILPVVDSTAGEYSHYFSPDVSSIRIDLHNNTIAILSMELAIDGTVLGKNAHEWRKLDEWTTVLVHQFLSEIYQSHIFPFLLLLNKLSQAFEERFVLDITQYSIFLDLAQSKKKPYYNLDYRFKLMWVNRTLCYSNEYPENNWIRSVIEHKESLKIEKADAYLGVGNNIVIMPADMDQQHLVPLWNAVLLAQYYYAALDVVNNNLIKYMGIAFNREKRQALYQLSDEMEVIVTSVTSLQMHYSDTLIELQGIFLKVFHILQKEWRFELLLKEVQKKLDLCKSNIALLNQEKNERNQRRTELVLIGLAGTNLVYLFTAISGYAISLSAQRKELLGNIPGFLDLGFMFSGNTLSWIGIFVTIIIMFFARQRRSR